MGKVLHPTAALIIWILAVLLTQYAAYPVLAGLALMVLASTPSAWPVFWQFVRRGRWLLLSLWLILAYGKPGEAWADLSWAPTLEGMAEANLQAARLLVVLACLAWILVCQGRDGLVSGLWGALRPLRALGMDVERLVVRLSLVLEHLQKPLPAGAWKSMLLMQDRPLSECATIHLRMPLWKWRDRLSVIGASAVFLWVVMQ